MINRLEPFILQKQKDVAHLHRLANEHPEHSIARILRGEELVQNKKSFKKALVSHAVIAEIKRKSPSNGPLADILDPVSLAHKYVSGGASAISILTEEIFFHGKLEDLTTVANTLSSDSIPILRKDFIIDEIQIAESLVAGANAILCIVGVLGKKTKNILSCAQTLGIEVLVEVIDQAELEIALEAHAEIIAVNNRNLKTFEVDPERAIHLLGHIPKHIVTVAASGIANPDQAKKYFQAGFNAVLIGEALVKSEKPDLFIRACQHG